MSQHLPPDDDLDAHLAAVLVRGPQPTRVHIADYDPRWPERYAARAEDLRHVLGDRALRIEHVGSTAVPGLAAKPIVDIIVAVENPDDEPAYLHDLEGAGYDLRVREPGHRCLRTGEPHDSVNLHIYADTDPEIERLMRFRDRLRCNAADRARYEAVKRELAGRDWPDVNHYAGAKTSVIDAILRAADEPDSVRVGRQTRTNNATGNDANNEDTATDPSNAPSVNRST